MRRRTAIAALGLVLVVLGGCARPAALPPPADTSGREHQQAIDALQRWDRAVQAAGGQSGFVPIGDRTTQVGDWEAGREENKTALAAGAIVSDVDGTQALPPSTVTWAQGRSVSVRTVTVDEAIARIRAGAGGCGGCGQPQPLHVTGARPTTAQVQTTRGLATAPAWELTLAGTAVRLVHIAVAQGEGVQVTPPPWDATNPPAGISIDKATVSRDGRRLTVTFVGSPGPASEPCGADYTASTVESGTAVVVLVHEQRHASNDPNAACPAIGAIRQATVDLERPLEDRAVLEVRTGMPVPVAYGS